MFCKDCEALLMERGLPARPEGLFSSLSLPF